MFRKKLKSLYNKDKDFIAFLLVFIIMILAVAAGATVGKLI